jgi:DNA-binding SARP family transcriptional activator
VLGSAKVRALTSALVLAGDQGVSTERLVEAVWGARPPRTARHAVQVHVSALRRHVRDAGGEIRIRSDAAGYTLGRDGLVVDVDEFETGLGEARARLVAGDSARAIELLESVRGLWRDDPYSELVDDPNAAIERERLRALVLEAEDEWAEACLASGRDADLVPALSAALGAEPLRERRARHLMVALYRAGRAPEALDVFQQVRDQLVDQLGLEPGPLLRETEHAVLTHDVALLGPRPITPTRSRTGRFVGRAEEWTRLSGVVSSTGSGSGRIVLVGGPAGIGKTRLVAEVTSSTGPLQVARGASPDGASAPPLWPIVEGLRNLEPSAFPDVGTGLDDEILEPLREMVVGGRPASSGASGGAAASDAFRLHEAVADLLVSIGRRNPLLVVLDDVHAADAATLGVVCRLATRVGREPVTVLATHRDTPGDHSAAFSSAMAVLARAESVDRIVLGPLDRDDVARYVSTGDGVGDIDVVDALFTRCEGSPLLLVELVDLLVERGGDRAALGEIPAGLAAVLDARLDQLGSGRRVVEQAAVLGPQFSVTTLARMSPTPTDELLLALDHASALGLIDPLDGDQRRFHHALIVDAATAAIPSTDRALLHLRAAEALERSSGSDPALVLTESARHRVAALPLGDPLLAASACVAAAELSARSSSDADTIAMARAARRALDLADRLHPVVRARALIVEGEAVTMAGGDARALLDEALDAARRAGEPELFAAAVRAAVLARSTVSAAGDPATVGLLDEALAALGDSAGWLAVQLSTDLAVALLRTDEWPRAVSLAEQALARARSGGDPMALAFALTGTHQAISDAIDAPRRLALAEEAVVAARAARLTWHESMAYSFVANDQWELGDFDAVVAALDECDRLAERSRRARFRWIAASWRALHELYTGDRATAEQLMGAALEPWHGRPNPDATLCSLSQQMNLALLDGDVEPFVGVARFQLEADAEPLFWHAVLALLSAVDGDEDEARVSLDQLVAIGPGALYPTVTRLAGLSFAAEAAARVGHVDAARAVYPVLAPYAGRHVVMNVFGGGGMCWGVADQGLALAAATMGDRDAAVTWQTSARALLEAVGARPFLERADQLAALIG